MTIPIIGPIVEVVNTLIKGVADHFKQKQTIREKANERRAELASDQQSFNHEWELRGLENAGWKDDVLFYAIIGMYAYSAFDPEGATKVFDNWNVIPEWFSTITMWMVAAVLGVKKIGDYAPPAIAAIKQAWQSVKKEK